MESGPNPQPSPVEADASGPQLVQKQKVPSCDPEHLYADVTSIFREIRRQRERPLFVLASGFIDDEVRDEVYEWKRELTESGRNHELDVLIHSPGGNLTSCYMIARLLSGYANAWHALVPAYAASGATLICLGSCSIVLPEIAFLGPIDPQVSSKRREKFFESERQSPLEAFQAVKYLREFALASLDASMLFLLQHQVAAERALETANGFALNLVRPILEQIEPYDLGAFALDSDLAVSYCQRVATPSDTSKRAQRNVAYRSLVERYPAHEFAIDSAEAEALGFVVARPSRTVDDLFDQLRPHLEEIDSYIGLVSEEERGVS